MDMNIPGGDYATARPTIVSMQNVGWKFVCRYLRDLVKANGDKSLSAAEATSLWLGGIDIVSNEETSGEQGLRGYEGGSWDAMRARRAHLDCGGPSDRPIYFSPWDHDPALLTSSQWKTMGDYLRGCASVLGLNKVGLYGGRAMLSWAFDNQLCTYGWQAAGWAHGEVESRAHIIQQIGSPIFSTDADTAVKADYGQWHWQPSTNPRGEPMILVRKTGETAVFALASGQLIHIGTEELRAYADIWSVSETIARASVVDLPVDAPVWMLPVSG